MVDYTPPDISEDDLKYSPNVVSRRFAQDLEDIVSIWMARYPKWFQRYDAIIIIDELKTRLEREENRARRLHHSKTKPEPQHGQYTWLEYRRQFVFINKAEAKRLHVLQEDDEST